MHPFQYVIGLFFAAWAMGAVFDVYNTVTGSSAWLRWLRPVLDLVFWVASALFVFYIMYRTDNGRMRLYVFLLLLAGYLLYRVILHHAVVRSAFTVVRLVRGIVNLLWRTIHVLVVRPVRAVLRALWRLVRMLYVLLCRLEDVAAWVLMRIWRLAAGWWWRRLVAVPWVARFLSRLRDTWEGFWMRASNWIRKHPRQA